MKLCQYTIFDNVHEAYHHPYSMENDAMALRQFANMANDDTQIAKNPEDYSLWHLGSFETTTGECSLIPHQKLAGAHEHIVQSTKS